MYRSPAIAALAAWTTACDAAPPPEQAPAPASPTAPVVAPATVVAADEWILSAPEDPRDGHLPVGAPRADDPPGFDRPEPGTAPLQISADDATRTVAGDLEPEPARTPTPTTAKIPRVRVDPNPEPDIGGLSRGLIRRVVRSHADEVRRCHEQGLARDPGLAGRVSIKFRIVASGAVEGAAVADATLADAGVHACLVAAVGRWSFPEPRGGSVDITYPFVFEPG